MAAVRDALQVWEIDQLTAGAVEIVLAEVLNNIVEHAYVDLMSGEICVWIERRTEDLAIAVIDDGRPLPGGTIPDPCEPDLDVATPDLPEGGFGWGLIRTLSSGLSYRRMSERNRLAFRIPLPNGGIDDP
ncbi:MAG: ATP-binding protein [Mangrovicoccus sp.]|nr:ATP-binding protein [Mangrovicoccus sp.]